MVEYDLLMSSLRGRALFLAVVFVSTAVAIRPENANTSAPVAMTSAQVVEQMRQHNQIRADGLKKYKELRHYKVEYTGLTTLSAEMEVEVSFDALSGKTFRIKTQSCSKLLCDRVLKRLVESENEAWKDQKSTALTAANYRFESAGSESVAGRPAYILKVEPLIASKFLYSGKIWVDAADFAVAKIEAEPSKSPSFWIKSTLIHHTYSKTGDFWLPERNRSETRVRLGGLAVLTIDYGTYQLVAPIVADALPAGLRQ